MKWFLYKGLNNIIFVLLFIVFICLLIFCMCGFFVLLMYRIVYVIVDVLGYMLLIS